MVNNVKLCFEYNGTNVELPINVSEEALRSLVGAFEVPVAPSNPSGYERVKHGEKYWVVDAQYCAEEKTELNMIDDDGHFTDGNYFADEDLAWAVAQYMEMWMRIRAYAARNGFLVDESSWVEDIDKWVIFQNMENGMIEVGIADYPKAKEFGTIFFNSQEAAMQTLDHFHDDLKEMFAQREALNV